MNSAQRMHVIQQILDKNDTLTKLIKIALCDEQNFRHSKV